MITFIKVKQENLPLDLTTPYPHRLSIVKENDDDIPMDGEGAPGLSDVIQSKDLTGRNLTFKITQTMRNIFNDYLQSMTSESMIACDSILSADQFKAVFPQQNIYIFTPQGEYRATYGESLCYDSNFAQQVSGIFFDLIYTENFDPNFNMERLKPGGRWIFKQIIVEPNKSKVVFKDVKIPYIPTMNRLKIADECQNIFVLTIQKFEKKFKIDLDNIHRIDPFNYLFSIRPLV